MGKKVDFDIVVIGGGIVGLASAYKLTINHPQLRIAVLEKEEKIATHQTGHNSGVLHSGLYYTPGSNKAVTCVQGSKELISFAKKYKIPHEISGKIIVAVTKRDLSNLDKIYENAQESHIEGVEIISSEQIKEIEPFCSGLGGLRVPCTGIIDFVQVAEKLKELIESQGNENMVLAGHEVTGLDKHDFYTKVVTNQDDFSAKFIINCAGLQSDRIAKADGLHPKMRIVPFRGDYYQLSESAKEKVKNLIYPVPDLSMPFLGVHFSRMIDGTVECGPNAVFSFMREGYRKSDFSMKDTWESLSYGGTWIMFLRNCRFGLGEYARAISKKLFLRSLKKLIPSLEPDDIQPCRAGVRAQAIGPRGDLIDDFVIEKRPNSIHVLNAPSPAATASLSIGERINQIATGHFKLK